ncbi:hypothetical protein [Sinorhizobium meliloti]|uniref:hypothetical protein n=1 Tax=Rhizobium meliloti TaxID=382 RepID=UPI00186597F1|nr:hypothetical protein [Sinorhizobium meliloti]
MHTQAPSDLGPVFSSSLMSFRAFSICAADRAGEGPNRTPRAFAAIRPALVRSTIKDRSKSAIPANAVDTMWLRAATLRGCRTP